MPKVNIGISDIENNFSRPVINTIVKDIAVRLDLPEKNIFTRTDLKGDVGEVSFDSKAKLTVDVNEVPNEELTLAMDSKGLDSTPFVNDTALSILARPIYVDQKITFSFTYRAQSRADARRFINKLTMMLENSQTAFHHQIEYLYPIPVPVLTTLEHIHSLREDIAPYDQPLVEYLRELFCGRVTVITQQNLQNPTFVVKELQQNVYGHLELDVVPESSTIGEGSEREVTFSYTVRLQKPIEVFFQYPVSVHNQLLASKFIPAQDLNSQLPTVPCIANKALAGLVDMETEYQRVGGVKIPRFDDWYCKLPYPHTDLVYQFLIALDLNDQHEILDLRDIGENTFNETIIEYINALGTRVFNYGKAPFIISLYSDDDVMSVDKLTIDDGVIRYTGELSLRKVTHLRISLLNDLSIMGDSNLPLLTDYPAAALIILSALEPNVADYLTIPDDPTHSLDRNEVRKVIELIKTTNIHYKNRSELGRVITGYFKITAKRKAAI